MGLRNILAHEYFGISLPIVVETDSLGTLFVKDNATNCYGLNGPILVVLTPIACEGIARASWTGGGMPQGHFIHNQLQC